MRIGWLVVLALMTGCGRLGFEAHRAFDEGDGSVDGAGVDDGTSGALTSGLSGYWKFDGTGTDEKGNTVLTPSPTGMPAYMPGKLGSGLFPGQYVTFMSCPSCVVLTSASTTAVNIASTDFTISVWANHVANSGPDGAWWSYGLIASGQFALNVGGTGANPTPVYATLHLYDTGTEVATVQDATLDFRAAANLGTWHHIVGYRRGPTIGVVVDGVETTASFAGTVGAPTTFVVGGASINYEWQGTLDEVAIWKRALSGSEIAAIYNGGAGLSLP